MYNRELLMCRPDFFRIAYSINPYMDTSLQPDANKLRTEYDDIVAAHEAAGRTVKFIEPDEAWPDMTYTANAALTRGKKAVMANLPPERAGEVVLMKAWLEANGFEVTDCPYLFSGQGDALPTGTGALIKGRGWRSDPRSDAVVADALDWEILPIQTVGPEWYDCDLSFGVIKPGLLAICWEALDEASQKLLKSRDDLRFIPVALEEAQRAACNLVSDGTTVVMANIAPKLKRDLEAEGFQVVEQPIDQLWLGGGAIRCTTLTLDND